MQLEAHPQSEELTSLFPIVVDESELSVYTADDLDEDLDASDDVFAEIDDTDDAAESALERRHRRASFAELDDRGAASESGDGVDPRGALTELADLDGPDGPEPPTTNFRRVDYRDELARHHAREAGKGFEKCEHAGEARSTVVHTREALALGAAYARYGESVIDLGKPATSEAVYDEHSPGHDADSAARASIADAIADALSTTECEENRDGLSDAERMTDDDELDDDIDVVPVGPRGALTFADRAREVGARFAMGVVVPVFALVILVIAMGGTWRLAGAAPVNPWLAASGASSRPDWHAAPSGKSATQTASAGRATGSAASDTTLDPSMGVARSHETVAGDAHADGAHDAARVAPIVRAKSGHGLLDGKININTASEDQLMLLPTVGPAKAERIVTWRKKNGGFKRTADLRRVKGFGYKTFKKLEPFLDIKGDTTLVPK